MLNAFFEQPILNSPYLPPAKHWELDSTGQPTHACLDGRRPASFVTPIPKPKKAAAQQQLVPDADAIDSTYGHTELIDSLRKILLDWRRSPESTWKVTPETARLLKHWRNHEFIGVRPFFCQIEAVEAAIWLSEVAPQAGKVGKRFIDHLAAANEEANPGLPRLALKLATGAGKTTVMAMLIAWQTVNAVRKPGSNRFSRAFLVVTPGLTIKDRLRVLLPNDPESYFTTRELVPPELLADAKKAQIVITNYHAFKLRDRVEIAKGTKQLLQGRGGAPLETTETEGQMLQRVMGSLMSHKNIIVINDEAHHCYRHRVVDDEDNAADAAADADTKEETKKNNESARLWISGLEAAERHLGLGRVFDLSATPFFLRGSGYDEGTLFPWTLSDFSLMDAIECGIVKLPRVPVADNIPSEQAPMFRNLWEHIRQKMPKKGRKKSNDLDPLALPQQLQTALEALYGHYQKTFELWEEKKISVPPCFIIVCNNTAASKLVYDYVSGFVRSTPDGDAYEPGKLELFQNIDSTGRRTVPRTLLIDSEQLESDDALDDTFKKANAAAIERFRLEKMERGASRQEADATSDTEILREIMNTVGKAGRLGADIRCVVSVSMLTEGWDTNTVTHILGVRAFGTQLLCEQVIGRALRRRDYGDGTKDRLLDVEYADILGIPFDFTAKAVPAPPKEPADVATVKALKERSHLEIRFPRVEGYRVTIDDDGLVDPEFNEDSKLVITPALVGPTITENAGIVGAPEILSLMHTRDTRPSTVLMHLTMGLLMTKHRDADGNINVNRFGPLKAIVRKWMDEYLECKGDCYPAQLLHKSIGEMAMQRIDDAMTRAAQKKPNARPIEAVLNPYNPVGTTSHVHFTTSRTSRYTTSPQKCHVNYVIYDSEWEAELCRVAEQHPQVRAYVKNHALGFEVPYLLGGEQKHYRPDFIVLLDDGHGDDDLLQLIVEVKGYRGEDAKVKASTMKDRWVPGMNNLKTWGRWAFLELTDVWTMQKDMGDKLKGLLGDELAKLEATKGGQ